MLRGTPHASMIPIDRWRNAVPDGLIANEPGMIPFDYRCIEVVSLL
jgi:hypothetical protein